MKKLYNNNYGNMYNEKNTIRQTILFLWRGRAGEGVFLE